MENFYSSVESHERNGNATIENEERFKGVLKLFGLKKCTDYNKETLAKVQYKELKTFTNKPNTDIRFQIKAMCLL